MADKGKSHRIFNLALLPGRKIISLYRRGKVDESTVKEALVLGQTIKKAEEKMTMAFMALPAEERTKSAYEKAKKDLLTAARDIYIAEHKKGTSADTASNKQDSIDFDHIVFRLSPDLSREKAFAPVMQEEVSKWDNPPPYKNGLSARNQPLGKGIACSIRAAEDAYGENSPQADAARAFLLSVVQDPTIGNLGFVEKPPVRTEAGKKSVYEPKTLG